MSANDQANGITENQERATVQTYDKYAASWANDHDTAVDYSSIISKLKELRPRGTVIDIGCGSGQDAELLAPVDYEYLGIDAAAGMVELARSRHPKLAFKQINLYQLSQLALRFDVFWCNAVLLHIPRRRINEALQAISSVIKANGIGYISMKDGDAEIFEEREKSDRQEKRVFVFWREDDFVKVLQRNGFEPVYYEYAPVNERSKWHRFIVRKAK